MLFLSLLVVLGCAQKIHAEIKVAIEPLPAGAPKGENFRRIEEVSTKDSNGNDCHTILPIIIVASQFSIFH